MMTEDAAVNLEAPVQDAQSSDLDSCKMPRSRSVSEVLARRWLGREGRRARVNCSGGASDRYAPAQGDDLTSEAS